MVEESLSFEQNHSYYQRSCQVMPGGVNSPVRAFQQLNTDPVVIQKGYLDRIQDVDGNWYVDFCLSWGALILGHVEPQVTQKVSAMIAKGSSFGTATPYEVQFAEMICHTRPEIELFRCVNSGTEATMTALRCARGFTGRSKIIKFEGCYHGHSDSLLVQAGSGVEAISEASSAGLSEGMVQDTIVCPYNDIERLTNIMESHGESIAAIIVEPIAANMGVILPQEGFLELCRSLTKKYDSLLIFDEVIVGYRLGLGGAVGWSQVVPDLVTLGKIIGGGYPLAGLGGRRDVMSCLAPLGDVYQAGTLSGNPVAVVAGLTVLQQLKLPRFYDELEIISEQFYSKVQKLIDMYHVPVQLHCCGSMWNLFFTESKVSCFSDVLATDSARFAEFHYHCLQRGFYLSPSYCEANFISPVHTGDHLKQMVICIEDFFKKISK